MFAFILLCLLAPPLLWLLAIRPYCRLNGKGYTPGANVGVTFWIDWQEAREMAKQKGDSGMVMICRLVLFLQILGFGAVVMALAGG